MGITYNRWVEQTVASFCDGKSMYEARIHSLDPGSARVLHFGCGRDLNGTRNIFRDAERVVGVDIDLDALREYTGLSWWLDGEKLPFADGSFDYVVSEYVLEHLDDPEEVFREVFRVLAPGGCFISLAPNKWSYKSLAAMMIPNKLHARFVSVLRPDSVREADDVYPTRFRANSTSALKRLAAASGGELVSVKYCNNGPTWFRRIPGVFELGLLFHRIIDWNALKALRCNLLVEMVKPGEGARSDAIFACPGCGSHFSGDPGKDDLQCEECSQVFSLSAENVYSPKVND